MGFFTGFMVYAMCWWVIFFMVLPIGIHTQGEEGDVVPGTVDSAPKKPKLLIKLAATTVVSAMVWGVIYYLIQTA